MFNLKVLFRGRKNDLTSHALRCEQLHVDEVLWTKYLIIGQLFGVTVTLSDKLHKISPLNHEITFDIKCFVYQFRHINHIAQSGIHGRNIGMPASQGGHSSVGGGGR